MIAKHIIQKLKIPMLLGSVDTNAFLADLLSGVMGQALHLTAKPVIKSEDRRVEG